MIFRTRRSNGDVGSSALLAVFLATLALVGVSALPQTTSAAGEPAPVVAGVPAVSPYLTAFPINVTGCTGASAAFVTPSRPQPTFVPFAPSGVFPVNRTPDGAGAFTASSQGLTTSPWGLFSAAALGPHEVIVSCFYPSTSVSVATRVPVMLSAPATLPATVGSATLAPTSVAPGATLTSLVIDATARANIFDGFVMSVFLYPGAVYVGDLSYSADGQTLLGLDQLKIPNVADGRYTLVVEQGEQFTASNSFDVVTPKPVQKFAPLAPGRLFDTRPGEAQGAATVVKQKYGSGSVLEVTVSGLAGIPSAGAGAVSLNVTVAEPEGPGFVTVYPCGTRPLASSLNFVAGQVVPNAVMAPLSADGKVCFYSNVPTHLIADVTGWFPSGDGFVLRQPVRVFDTRPSEADGAIVVTKKKYSGADVVEVTVAGVAGVPTQGTTAVSLNVTVAEPDGAGFVTVYPCGTRPLASSLNFVAGQVVPNAVIAPLSADGKVCFYSNVPTHVIADINGWFSTGGAFTPSSPVRVFDTRPGEPQGSVSVTKQKYGLGETVRVKIAGTSSVPSTGAGAVSLNVTVAEPDGAGFVTVYPCGTRPLASSLNFVAGQVVPNAVIAPLSADGEVCFYSNVTAHLIADLNGWFAA